MAAACQKDDESFELGQDSQLIQDHRFQPDDQFTSRAASGAKGHMRKLARSLALSLNDDASLENNLRSLLAEEWGDDFQILFKNAKIHPGKGQGILNSLKSKGLDDDDLSALSQLPKVRILAPEGIMDMEWSQTVVVLEHEDGDKFVRGFDRFGKPIKMDADIEPDFPVLVVGFCELCDENGELRATPESGATKSHARARVSGNQEVLLYKVHDLNAIEHWTAGKLELRFLGALYDNSGSTARQAFSVFRKVSRNTASHGSWIYDDLFNWYFDDHHGPDYHFQIIEEDGGGEFKITVGVSIGKKDSVTGTASFQYTTKSKDDNVFGRLIHYRDTESRYYSSGDVMSVQIAND